MKKFEQELKQKAHLNKIKNAKKTVSVSNKTMHKITSAKSEQAQVLLNLYEKKRFDSIPAYKLLRTAGLQQYTKGFIERGYGVKLGALSALSDKDKEKLYEDLKILPGHTVKLDRLIQKISKHANIQSQQNLSFNMSNYDQKSEPNDSSRVSNLQLAQNSVVGQEKSSKGIDKFNIDTSKFKLSQKYDPEFEKQLERVFNEYTPNASEKNNEKKTSIFGDTSGGTSLRNNKLHATNSNKLEKQDLDKKLQRVSNQFTPLGDNKDKKKRTFGEKITIEKKTPVINSVDPSQKYTKTKPIPNTKPQQIDFKKKTFGGENKATVKKIQTKTQIPKPKSGTNISTDISNRLKNINLGIDQPQQQISTAKLMQINLDYDKIKSLYRSFDGSLMSSTIANIDIEELVYAFAGYVCANVIAAPQPQQIQQKQANIQDEKSGTNQIDNVEQCIEDEVENILKESYLHPLYTQDAQINEDIDNAEQTQGMNEGEDLVNSEGEEEETNPNQFLQVPEQPKNLQASSVSSFLGAESYHFGLAQPLHIFDEPEPTQLDYLKPTADSVANFIKNIVLTAKMQREIPIMAARYLQVFMKNTGIIFTSLNYRRLLVTVLLLASKIWDDQSFESPSFSKTFPEYNTILLNQMQKEILKALDYKLKLDKKEFAQIYFQLRKYVRKNLRSCQNKKINLQRIRQLQLGEKKNYKSNYLEKRPSF